MAYGLLPTMKDGEVCFKCDPCPQEDLDNFKKMIEYWARLRDNLENSKIIETRYYLKEIKFPINPIKPNKEYTIS